MTRRVDTKGDPINPNSRRRVSAHNTSDPDVNVNASVLAATQENALLLAELMTAFVAHDAGFLKIRRSADSSDLHLTWSWSLGQAAGTYVYVRVEAWRLTYGLDVLRTKVLEVERGVRMATADKYRS